MNPAALTSFVGRQAEVAEVIDLLTRHRMVTILGPGGIGKTRLAERVAEELRPSFGPRVHFVDLAPLTDPSRVGPEIVRALGMTVDPSVDPVAGLIERVSTRSLVVTLDNCEHLLLAVAALCHQLLDPCPNLRLLATSRRALEVPREVSWRIPALAIPPEGAELTLSELAEVDTVELFVQRARLVSPGFGLGPGNRKAVSAICRSTFGVPLALELAAARSHALPLDQIRRGLADAFSTLSPDAAGSLPRQDVLETSISWSCALLSAEVRSLLRRLSVFSGGWDLAAAQGICVGSDLDPATIEAVLSQLVTNSLVVLDIAAGRYDMLEAVRHHAAGELLEADETDEMLRRHACHYAALASGSGAASEGPGSTPAIALVRADAENLMATLGWLERHDPDPGLAEATWQLRALWVGEGFQSDGINWLTRALDALPRRASVVRARLFAARCELRLTLGDVTGALDDGAEAVAIGDRAGDQLAVGRAHIQMGLATAYVDVSAGLELIERGVAGSVAARDRFGLALGRNFAAIVHMQHQDLVDGKGALEQAEAAVIALASPAMSFFFHTCEALASLHAADYDAVDRVGVELERTRPLVTMPAVTLALAATAQAAAAFQRQLSHPVLEELEARFDGAVRDGEHTAADVYAGLLIPVRIQRGDLAAALSLADNRAVSTDGFVPAFEVPGDIWGASIAQALGDTDGAWRRLDRGERRAAEAQLPMWSAAAAARRAVLHRHAGQLATAETAAHDAIDIQIRHGYRADLAGSLETLAGLATAHGSFIEAAQRMGTAHALRKRLGFTLHLVPDHDQLLADLVEVQQALGRTSFDRAFRHGSQLGLDAVVIAASEAHHDRPRPSMGWDSLTPTELRVAELAQRGLTNRQIAAKLVMGSETVKTHISRVFEKLDLRNRAQLARLGTKCRVRRV